MSENKRKRIKPFDDKVVVEPIDLAPQVSPGGIFLPEQARVDKKSNMIFAKVVAVGPDVKKCGPGDIVVMNRYAADFFHINGEADKRIVVGAKDLWVGLEDEEDPVDSEAMSAQPA